MIRLYAQAFLILLLLTPLFPARADDASPLVLSVEEAVFRALENNRDLSIERLNPVIAGAFETIEQAAFDPELFFDLVLEREMDGKDATDRTAEAAAGVRQRLSHGTLVEAGLVHEKDSSGDRGSEHRSGLALSVTQPLLQGRGTEVSLAAVRQRAMDVQESLHEVAGFTQALVAQTEKAYWHYVLALKEISIYERSLAVATQQRDEIEQQINVGLLPENEAAAARAEEAIRDQALIDARTQACARRLDLLRLLNVDRPDRAVIPSSVPAIHSDPIPDAADRMELALVSRPDLKEAEFRKSRGELSVIVTKNGLLPRLDLFFRLGINGFGSSPSASAESISLDDYDAGVGIRLSRVWGDRAAKARHREAMARDEQAGIAVANLRHAIRYQVSQAVNELARARRQIDASRRTREYEEQTVMSEQARFKVGTGTSLLVARAQRDLLASRIAEVRSVINYRTALVDLYLAEGSLLLRRGISLDRNVP